jgi:hypothetical protein
VLTSAKIPRRIYTTARNGVYAFTPASLIAGTASDRVSLWPDLSWLPTGTDYSGCASLPGANTCSFDVAAGLPNNNPTAYPTNVKAGFCTSKTYDQCWFDALQKDFKACLGNAATLPTACTSTNANTRMRAARREARDMMMAFMAGAAAVPDATGVKRTTAAVGSAPARSLLFKARSWVLADSELATAGVVTPPNLNEPAVFVPEYELMRDGPRTATGNPDSAGTQIRQGFGLAQPDDDGTTGSNEIDGRAALKPVMTVVYAPANDMLHAFRAGPCYSPSTSPSNCYGASVSESGGEELWGFLPYDQLASLYLRAANEPQGRANHVYTLARGVRFADVFVPSLDAQGRPRTMSAQTIGGVSSSQDPRLGQMNGVWRRVLYIGRGIGGKYVTAIDVTAPGPYTATALNTIGPIPLWSRGNPDTDTGLASGSNNGTVAERTAYAKMGETWSMPTVAFVNPTNSNAIYNTSRRPAGVNFAIFMGSGYGASGEGTTHYALDALSGDVIAAVDVEPVAAANGLSRTRCSKDPATGKYVETPGCSVMDNALVANSVSFNRSAFKGVALKKLNLNPHPWSFSSARVYAGDLHGRLWKFLTDRPDLAIPIADLGADQPVGTAVALLAEGEDPETNVPVIFASSGADRRASGPFRNFTFRDDGTDTETLVTGSSTDDGVTTFAPAVKLFARTYDQGTPDVECGYTTEAVFRGTIQPAGAVECTGGFVGGKCQGELLQRVFFGGTRLSVPNTRFAPETPLACSQGSYPCRSRFDSILYVLGVKTGSAAYDLNASGDDAYRIFRDSRIAAASIVSDPDPSDPNRTGSTFQADEGLMKGTPKPPPPPGVPPMSTTASANVVFQREPGQPAPAVRYGTTVCQ